MMNTRMKLLEEQLSINDYHPLSITRLELRDRVSGLEAKLESSIHRGIE